MLDPCLFEWQRYSSLEDAVSRFKSIKGLGDWTAQYIALRGLHDPDAFPRGDAALQRSFAQRTRQGSSAPGDLTKQAESWRPWRAYAAQHLWHADVRENG
jgi:3-methyladenine DNA glycosylase/8-oxoguanine DNA glycosylase